MPAAPELGSATDAGASGLKGMVLAKPTLVSVVGEPAEIVTVCWLEPVTWNLAAEKVPVQTRSIAAPHDRVVPSWLTITVPAPVTATEPKSRSRSEVRVSGLVIATRAFATGVDAVGAATAGVAATAVAAASAARRANLVMIYSPLDSKHGGWPSFAAHP